MARAPKETRDVRLAQRTPAPVRKGSRGLLQRFGFAGPQPRPVREDVSTYAPTPDAGGRLEAKCIGCDPHVLVVQLDPLAAVEDLEASAARVLEESGWTFTAAGARCPECSQ